MTWRNALEQVLASARFAQRVRAAVRQPEVLVGPIVVALFSGL